MKTGKLSGSMLLETMVASVLFLLIFSISLTCLVRMSLKKGDYRFFIASDAEYRRALGDCMHKKYDTGEYTEEYEWGTLEITVEPYKEDRTLRKVTILSRVQKHQMGVEYIHLVDYEE